MIYELFFRRTFIMQTYASMEKTALLHELAKLEGYYENYKAEYGKRKARFCTA